MLRANLYNARGALAVADEEEQALAILLILGQSFAAPWQSSFDFQLQRQTQERADQHN